MATLAENAAAVKAAQVAIDAAIVAKGGMTDGGLANAAAAIEALPSGGNITRIAEVVKTMDGIERENPDEAELAKAITEITRQPNRRGDVQADEQEWTADEGKTAFVVKVDETSGFDFIVGCLWIKSGSASATIDWGDGSTSMVTQSGVVRERHFYATAGYYLLQISDDIIMFLPHLNEVNGSTFNGYNGRLPQGSWSVQQFDDTRNFAKANNDNIDKIYRVVQWGASITKAQQTYSGCSGLTGAIPAWGASITKAQQTYYGCSGLTGAIPAWGASITNAHETYNGCSGLTGAIPAWGASITTAQRTYYGCSGLTGTIPAWGASITDAYATYYGCSGLTGTIPAWGASITNAQETYRWCFGLTSIWDDAVSDAEIMPPRITTKTNCVNNTSETLRAFFLTAWGGSRAS